MKKVLFIAVAIAATFAFASCKKCVTCSYEYDYLGAKQSVLLPQQCGTSKQNKNYKDNAESEANLHGVSASCTTSNQ
jgi:hypothetical protein